MPEGQIRKAISGFYYVEKDGELDSMQRARGIQEQWDSSTGGRYCHLCADGDNDGTITEVHERTQ